MAYLDTLNKCNEKIIRNSEVGHAINTLVRLKQTPLSVNVNFEQAGEKIYISSNRPIDKETLDNCINFIRDYNEKRVQQTEREHTHVPFNLVEKIIHSDIGPGANIQQELVKDLIEYNRERTVKVSRQELESLEKQIVKFFKAHLPKHLIAA